MLATRVKDDGNTGATGKRKRKSKAALRAVRGTARTTGTGRERDARRQKLDAPRDAARGE